MMAGWASAARSIDLWPAGRTVRVAAASNSTEMRVEHGILRNEEHEYSSQAIREVLSKLGQVVPGCCDWQLCEVKLS